MTINNSELKNFFLEFEEKNSFLILFYIIVSFSLYTFYWLYELNKKIILVDDEAPEPRRAFTVILILPLIWYLITYLIKKYIFHINNYYLIRIYWKYNIHYTNLEGVLISSFEIIGWVIIFIIILKYFYDFSISFGRITKTPHIIWYVFLSSEVFGLIFFLLNLKSLLMISFFTILAIPVMQEKLNSIAHKIKIEEERKIDYMYGSNG